MGYRMYSHTKSIVLMDGDTKDTLRFERIKDAEVFLNKYHGYIEYRTKNYAPIVVSDERNYFLVLRIQEEKLAEPQDYDYYLKHLNSRFKRKARSLNHQTNRKKVKECLAKINQKYKSLTEACNDRSENFTELQHLYGVDS